MQTVMKNLLLSEAIGDIAGSAYEFSPVKDKNRIKMFARSARFTDDTVCTFACAEALLKGIDIGENLYTRCKDYPDAGYGRRFYAWLASGNREPYQSFGNGSAMRCSAAGWLANSEEECVELATKTALSTHNHPEGIKGAVSTALAIFLLRQGGSKELVREKVLEAYYPEWAGKTYYDIQPTYTFDETCQLSIGPAIISFLESDDYETCIRLCISLGGDADTLAAIAGPMAYAYYREMPAGLVEKARAVLPEWMLQTSDDFDKLCNKKWNEI